MREEEMRDEELIGALADRWQEHFADGMARRVCEAGAVGVLYRIAAGLPGEDKESGESGGTGKTGLSRGIGALPNPVRHKIRFRAAYVLERLYFTAPEHFMPHAEAFCRRDFPACGDPSARRHFAKIMADLLRREGRQDITMEVDGNITPENARRLRAVGASIFVAGTSSIFRGDISGYADNIDTLRAAIE